MRTVLDQSAARVEWYVTANDTGALTFRLLDDSGDPVDPDTCVFFGQVRDRRGGEVVGDLVWSFDGFDVTHTLPDEARETDGSYWWEYEVTDSNDVKLTTVSGPLRVEVDSAEEGGS